MSVLMASWSLVYICLQKCKMKDGMGKRLSGLGQSLGLQNFMESVSWLDSLYLDISPLVLYAGAWLYITCMV